MHRHALRFGWQYWQMQTPPKPEQGSAPTNAVVALAIAFSAALTLASALAFAERTLGAHDASTVRALLGISIAHAAEPMAPLLIRSHRLPIETVAGTEVTMQFGFKNATKKSWTRGKDSMVFLTRTDAATPSVFMAANWLDTSRAAMQTDEIVAPGNIIFITANFRAPDVPGTYKETFTLRSLDGTVLIGSENELTIAATSRPEPPPPAVSGWRSDEAGFTPQFDPSSIAFERQYTEEPRMRIGIVYHEPTDQAWAPHRITAQTPFRITTESGAEIFHTAANSIISIDYRPSTKTYHLYDGSNWYTSGEPVQFVSDDPTALVALPSYTEKLRWEGNTEDNIFNGLLEVRYVPETERLWVINDLPIEKYLRGLVETSDGARPEFHKAQAVAARTFALYYLEAGGKYKNGQFILRNDARDQVYRGENAAQRRPNFVRAVEATRGVVATYGSDIAVTPYYAQSDGRTRSYDAVWGGQPRAWLISIADPICDGKKLIGHGVGMPQRCAMTLSEQGWNFGSILLYYYPGIQLKKLYE
ncbi:MAG: SpoIID/LytB domain-containing protein [Candidatus Uhrbacteria bacterium]